MTLSYADFLASKRRVVPSLGIHADDLPSILFDWQAAIVRWALRKGRAAIFADCGLGKSFMQVSWARALDRRTLFLAPLCVAEQTVTEAAKLGVRIAYARRQEDAAADQFIITNYERLDDFDVSSFGAVVLDESSILKAFDGQTRNKLIAACASVPYRLCCTATPSPNDIAELANHAEFLGLMTRPEFLATWFVKVDQGQRTTDHHGWRLKGHARRAFFRWLSSWAIAMRTPSDLGYSDAGFELPPLTIHDHILPVDGPTGDTLFAELSTKGLKGRLDARRGSLDARVRTAADLVTSDVEQWLAWCGLNAEQDAIVAALTAAHVSHVSVEGRTDYNDKVTRITDWTEGRSRVMVSKPEVLGFGMNFQHCARALFVGIGDSYEKYYQAIRRIWRFGQTRPVQAHVIVSEAEQVVVENVRRKEAAAANLSAELLAHMRDFEREELAS